MVRYFLILLGLSLTMANNATAAQFNASVDRHQLNMSEKVTLTLSLINSDVRLRAEGIDPNIDLSPLHRDFDVGKPETDFRYNIYQGQGRSNSQLRVELFPRHPGQITIPAFRLDGLSTQPIQLEVKQAAEAPEVFIRQGGSKETIWQGEQLVVYIDIYHRVKLKKAKKSGILETEPSRIELIPHWALPQARYQSEHQGFQYDVLRLAWALFPEETGPFYVYLPKIEVTTEAGQTLYFPHQQLDFTVQALPAGVPRDIIIGHPEISYDLLPTHLEQNQLSSFTITIKAPVAISDLPNYLPALPDVTGIKIYPDRARRDSFKSNSGIVDQAAYTFSVMPLEGGNFTLPAIAIPYFDPDEGKIGLFEIPEQKLIVAKASIAATAQNPLPYDSAPRTSPSITEPSSYSWWPFTTALFLSLWLATLAYTLHMKRRRRPAKDTANEKLATPRPLSQEERPLDTLLEALGTKSLESGIDKFKRLWPQEEQIINQLRQLQKILYSQKNEMERDQTEELIRKLIISVNNSRPETAGVTEENDWIKTMFKNQTGAH